MDRHDGLAAVLAVGVVVVRVGAHGARPVERADGGDVSEGRRAHRSQQRAHAAAFELEDPEGVAAAEQVVGVLVGVKIERLEHDFFTAVVLDAGKAVVEDR